jgi:N-acetylneuraminic acid mutarotase
MPYDNSEAQGRVVNNKLYSFGGFDVNKLPTYWTSTKRAHIYDPENNSWSAIADLPHTPNGTNFGGITHAGIATDGTDIYFAGGYTSNAEGTGQIFGTKQVWKYNVALNNYSSLPDLPIDISTGQMEYLTGKLHYIAGTNIARNQDLGIHYVLDLDDLDAGWKTLAALPNPRQHAGSAVFEGKIYFIGGQSGHDSHLVTQKDVHVYDPSNNTWEKMADLPVPAGKTGRGHITSTVVVLGERIIVLGGETAHGERTNFVSAYTPSTNTWSNLTPLPVGIATGIAGVLNRELHYIGGDFQKTNRKGTYSGSNSQPEVNIIKPQPYEFFPVDSPIEIEVEATVNSGTISKVEFYADDVKVGEDSNFPYSFSWDNVDAGTYNLIARAINDKGAISSSASVFIQVSESNIPPLVNITSPADGAKFLEGNEIIISAEASDEDGNILRVEFFNNEEKIGEDSTSPFQFTWTDVPPGNYNIKVRAFDNSGASSYSSVINIEVLGPDSPPVISVISPVSGSEFEEGVDILLEIEALDANNSITKVEIYQNEAKLTELTNFPYTYTWTNVQEGSYQLSAIAYTNGDEEIFSDTIDINVLPAVLTSIDDESLKNSNLTIYPVPSSGKIYAKLILDKEKETSLDIFNSQGLLLERILTGKANAGSVHIFEIDGLKLNNGIYFIKINTEKTYLIKKFIVNR